MDAKIGLEIHGYLNTPNNTKLFCECEIDRDSNPNTNICPICTGQPGSKPMLPNEQALHKIIAIALMLDCDVNTELMFQRKHYSWPDLPNGYQKTMSGSYSIPVAINGEFLDIGIKQIHLEEDPAKWDPETGKIDYNRSGYPLVEIVTEPDFESSEQVEEWLRKLMTTLSYIQAVEKSAGIKCDVNVSTAPNYERTEVKNVNSVTSIVEAINYELERQQNAEAKRQTRAWNEFEQKTEFMREKETAQDYMFIPEPDLPTIPVSPELLEETQAEIPEKPQVKYERFRDHFNIKEDDAFIISRNIVLSEMLEEINEDLEDPQFIANWLRRDVIGIANELEVDLDEVDVQEISECLKMKYNDEISNINAKKLLRKIIKGEEEDARDAAIKSDLTIISEEDKLEEFADEAIEEKNEAVQDYLEGEQAAINAVVGYVMQKTKGKANPEKVKKILRRKIDGG